MKSLNRQNIAGNAKLRGKKFRLLSCRCCSVENFKHEERVHEKLNEIKEYPDMDIVLDEVPLVWCTGCGTDITPENAEEHEQMCSTWMREIRARSLTMKTEVTQEMIDKIYQPLKMPQ